MDKETLRMQMLAGVITESEYVTAINEKIEEENKSSLNEHMIGGIVGVGAINQIPSRAKEVYEDAFEHFLGGKYGLDSLLKEEEEVEEGKEGKMYFHVLEDGGYGEIGWKGVYNTEEEAQNRADSLSDMFSDSSFYVEVSDSEDEPYSVTMEEGKEVEEPSLYEEELEEAGKPGTAKERSAMAKKARAGKDIGEKGKNFEKIAKSATKKYGSEEAGKKVAGAVMYGKLNK